MAESTAAAPPPEPSAQPPSPADALIDAWFIETIHNQGFAVPQFNRLFAAKENLKSRLAALTAKE